MARIRNIKPEFFTSEAVSALPLRARLTWIGLWVHCDNHGRARDNVRIIKGAVWPLDDVSLKDIEEDLATLADHGRIVRYEVDGKRYLEVTNWGEHQYGAFKDNPKYPDPNDGVCLNSDGSKPDSHSSGDEFGANPVDNSAEAPENGPSPASPQESKPSPNKSRHDVDKSGPIQGLGVKGQGGGTREADAHADPRPHDRCPKHRDVDNPPNCIPCRDAREAAEQWDDAEITRAEAIARDIEQAKADPRQRCEHGHDGGRFRHPRTGLSATCALCRRTQQREAS